MIERRKTYSVKVGNQYIGSAYPICIQSMANTDTNDIISSTEQTKRIVEAGGQIVRFTTQGSREVESLQEIHNSLRKQGITVPLVADVHFNANVADLAAQAVEKVRINPGNYVDPARKFLHIEYTDEEYRNELERLRERFVRLLNICKQHQTALRIGVNHGSLSDRIMSRYGDTPQGMVESCMEFLRICVSENFYNVVISIKASNTQIMVRTVMLLVESMNKEDLHFPLHLGVTEAGEGEDGRVKSAVGIGALLSQGIGDTIRVSLSEAPEAEIPVAQHLIDYFYSSNSHRYTDIRTSVENNCLTIQSDYTEDWRSFALQMAAEAGKYLLVDQVKDIRIINPHFSQHKLEQLQNDILQAARIKIYKTEYISCPSCGRTLFDIEKTIKEVKQATSHLKGLKIAIMGCIVNGPGEMADADYGYVGAGRGKISLYKGKECVLKNIPQENAVDELLKIINAK